MIVDRILRPEKVTLAFSSAWRATSNRAIAFAILGFLLLFPKAAQCLDSTAQQQNKSLSFEQLLRKMTELPPDPCGLSTGREEDWHTADIEYRVFARARDSVTQALNTKPGTPESPLERATAALKGLEQMSAAINADWPEENRFHFQVLDLTEALVVKMTIRTDGRYFVFGMPEERISEKAIQLWQPVGSDEKFLGNDPPTFSLELFPLHRGPSGNARFLAKLEYTGCAGSIGVAYEGREWDPEGFGHLAEIINQSGSFGLSDGVSDSRK